MGARFECPSCGSMFTKETGAGTLCPSCGTPGIPLSGGTPRPAPAPATRADALAQARALAAQGSFEAAAQLFAKLGDREGVEVVARSLPPRTAAAALCAVGSFFRAAERCLEAQDQRTAYECLLRVANNEVSYPEACRLAVEQVWPMRYVDARLLDFLASWTDNPWPSFEDVEALCHVAVLTAKLGRADAARALFSRVLAGNPTYGEAIEGMRALDADAVVQGVALEDHTLDRIFVDSVHDLDDVTQNIKIVERVDVLNTDTLIAGRYRLGKKIGGGGMGVVFEAVDQELNEDVALKFLLPLADKTALARFKREIAMSRRLVHQNIARVFDLGVQDDLRYVTMERLSGEDLGSRMTRPMAMQVIVDVLAQCARGLHAAHTQGIVHRDVKPANIFLVDGVVKVMDFGFARDAGAKGLTQVGDVVGTPRYMAPEAFIGDVGPAADLYSLGVTAYEVLCGAAPFEDREQLPLMWKHAGEKPVPPIERNRAVPEPLNALVMQLLAKKPEQRPQSAAVVADELEKLSRWLVLNAPTIRDDDDA